MNLVKKTTFLISGRYKLDTFDFYKWLILLSYCIGIKSALVIVIKTRTKDKTMRTVIVKSKQVKAEQVKRLEALGLRVLIQVQ